MPINAGLFCSLKAVFATGGRGGEMAGIALAGEAAKWRESHLAGEAAK